MIIAGYLLLEDSVAGCRLVPGAVRTEDDRIVEIIPELPAAADAGGPDSIVMPGFIDAHLHLPQFDITGGHGLALLDWLSRFTFPAELKWEDVNFATEMTHRVANELVSFGTTGIAAFATVHHSSTLAALKTLEQIGLRGMVGQVLMDRNAPPELCRSASSSIEETARLLELFPPEQRLAAAVTPRFAIACSSELMSMAGQLASERGAMIQSHLAETVEECRRVGEEFQAGDYVQVYQQHGLLGERSLFAHAIHLRDAERQLLSQTRTSIAHCPTANSFLRSGVMNRGLLNAHKIPIALGSDLGAGYERSMVRVGRAMIEAAATLGTDYPSAAQAWYAITAGNADILGWTDAGRLQVGHAADLVLVEPTIPWQQTSVDPLSRLMFSWDDRWIQNTMLRGRWAHV